MAVKKITWKQLMSNLSSADLFSGLEAELANIDSALNDSLDSYNQTPIKDVVTYIKTYIVTDSNNGIWKELPIYVSSFKENDLRFMHLLKAKIREYLGFYYKILTDEGVQRHLVYAKSYDNDGNSSAIERGFNSNTPQNSMLYNAVEATADTNFDQAIADYASNIDKNKSKTTSHTEGTSDTTVSGTTWEEGKKNVELFFFNELKDYLFSLPERIYHHYSLETVPAPELFKKFIEHLEEVREIVENE